jgi:hypothetical protein
VSRNDDIVAMRRADPYLTLQAIATEFGVSRERIRQILSAEGVTTTAVVRYKYICNGCGKPTSRAHRAAAEPMHKGCRYRYNTVNVSCAQCGVRFRTTRGMYERKLQHRHGYKTQRWFCDRRCNGRFIGLHFGRRRKFQDGDQVKHISPGSKRHREHTGIVLGLKTYTPHGSSYIVHCSCGREITDSPASFVLSETRPQKP